jgi:hypothetical protein
MSNMWIFECPCPFRGPLPRTVPVQCPCQCPYSFLCSCNIQHGPWRWKINCSYKCTVQNMYCINNGVAKFCAMQYVGTSKCEWCSKHLRSVFLVCKKIAPLLPPPSSSTLPKTISSSSSTPTPTPNHSFIHKCISYIYSFCFLISIFHVFFHTFIPFMVKAIAEKMWGIFLYLMEKLIPNGR